MGLGDQLWITEVPGGLKLSPLSQEDTETMEVGRRVMRKHREVLKRLADG